MKHHRCIPSASYNYFWDEKNSVFGNMDVDKGKRLKLLFFFFESRFCNKLQQQQNNNKYDVIVMILNAPKSSNRNISVIT